MSAATRCSSWVFVYAIGFIGNFAVPTSLDGPAEGPVGIALATNLLLLGVFAVPAQRDGPALV